MLRVLSISTLFPNAARPAFGLFVARQAEALVKRGDTEMVVINPVAIAPPPFDRFINSAEERALPATAQDWGVTVHYPRFPYIPRYGVRWNAALIARTVLPLAKRLHADQPFDIVDAQFFYPDGYAAAQVAKALGLPLSIKARGSDIILWSQKPFARKQLLAAADQAAGMLAVSEALKRDMVALGMAEDRIMVHYTGLDHSRFHPLPRPEARAASTAIAPSEGKLLVTVGNLVHHKGQHLVIEALQQLPDTRLVLAGKGIEEARLRALVSQLGLSDRVHFAGSVKPDQLAVLLSAADIMVLASEREGLANAWVEALACGTPIVIAEAGGAREVVRNSSAGQIVDRSVAGIVTGVRAVLAEPPTQSAARTNAERFSWDANAEKLASHYQQLVAEG